MGRGELLQQGYKPFQALRSHFCKIIAFAVLVFLLLEYAVLSPKLSWISSSLQHKISSGIQSGSVIFESRRILKKVDPPINSTRTLLKNSTSLPKASESSSAESISLNSSHTLPDCPLVPPKLVGRLKVMMDAPSFEELEKMMIFLEPGGRYRPSECKARHKVALVIPYRDREEHLRIFLHNLHPILQRQQLDYGIYVVEESGNTKFNRAMLMNIGFVEALKQYDYDCFIFHDVDLIPEDDRNLYTCPEQPRHMSVAINTMNYRLPYKDIFGGVSALTKKHMKTLNGFSNEFWGWGGEDDDMSNRIRYHGFKITRYSPNIARYTMLKHHKDVPNPERYNKLYKGKYRFGKDGLSNLKYNRLDIVLKKLYTWVLVDVKPLS